MKIWVFGLTQVRLEIKICVSTIYGYHYQDSTRLRYQRFENSLEFEPRVGILIHQSLVLLHGLHFMSLSWNKNIQIIYQLHLRHPFEHLNNTLLKTVY